jgi:hypothetical protein
MRNDDLLILGTEEAMTCKEGFRRRLLVLRNAISGIRHYIPIYCEEWTSKVKNVLLTIKRLFYKPSCRVHYDSVAIF